MKQTNEIIRELREDRDMSQAKVAKLLGISPSQYGKYERGENNIPFNNAIKLTEFYGVTLDYISGKSYDRFGLGENAAVSGPKPLTATYNCAQLLEDAIRLKPEQRKELESYMGYLKDKKAK